MALAFFSSLTDLTVALQRFTVLSGAALPEHTREQLIEFSGHPSPVDRVVNVAEALYAARDELTNEGRDMAAQLAQFAAVNGWHGMTERGAAMAAVLQRDAGHEPPPGMSWPDHADDPDALVQFLPPLATVEPQGTA